MALLGRKDKARIARVKVAKRRIVEAVMVSSRMEAIAEIAFVCFFGGLFALEYVIHSDGRFFHSVIQSLHASLPLASLALIGGVFLLRVRRFVVDYVVFVLGVFSANIVLGAANFGYLDYKLIRGAAGEVRWLLAMSLPLVLAAFFSKWIFIERR